MVMYDNEYKTKKIKFEPRIKLNHNICIKYKVNVGVMIYIIKHSL